jgi:hypothetical protein
MSLVSTIFQLDIGTVQKVWDFLFFILSFSVILKKNYYNALSFKNIAEMLKPVSKKSLKISNG